MSQVTADTSVVVPALSAWHEFHAVTRAACRSVTALPAQVVLEATSILSRLPGGVALDPATAIDLIRAKFPGDPLILNAVGYEQLLKHIAEKGIRGGQVYDALVGAGAAAAGVRLLTRDARAERTYQAIGVEYELVS